MKNKLSSVLAAAAVHTLAVAAILAAASGCEKPANSEEPSPGPAPEKSVSLSLGSGTLTKTVLGEPDGSAYPVYWCEGDRIAVNGQRSEPLHGVGDKATDATFSVSGVSAPYGVVYPSWICGAMDGNSAEITLQTVQKWIPGSFGNGSAVLYGQSDATDFTLTNLCGVVRIPVDFGKYEVTDITLTSLGTPIAGKFSLNLADGKLTAVEAGQDISLSIPEGGFAEGSGAGSDADSPDGSGDGSGAGGAAGVSEAVELNFCVPAGEYAEGFNLTITEKYGRKMVIEMRENTAVHSGVIVGWAEQTFVPSGALIITDPESWNSFAAAVNAGDYSSWKDPESGEVSIVANVTSADELTQIQSWDGVLNGGGYIVTRNSLTKPLIKSITETGIVKNLRLGGLRTEKSANSCASLAAVNLGTVENCENRAALTATVDANFTFCSLVEMNGGVMKDCVNSADFEINLPFTANHLFMGGGIAYRPDVTLADKTTKLGTFEGCRNVGNITILKPATASSDLYKCAVGGILASAYAGTTETFVTLKNCVNEGNITLWENTFGNNPKTQGAYCVGGIVGRIAPVSDQLDNNKKVVCNYITPAPKTGFYSEITGCSNVGTIDVCSSIQSNVGSGLSGARQCHVGGIAGVIVGKPDMPAILKDCINSGRMLSGGTNSVCALAGGIVGSTAYSEITSCTNKGSFGLTGNTLATPVNNKIGAVGGIVSFVLKVTPVPTITGCASTGTLPPDANVASEKGIVFKGPIYAAGNAPTIK